MGFGIETDVRDRLGELVISHDPASRESPSWDAALGLYRDQGRRGALAINIKADSLQELLADSLRRHGIDNYFVFDMSVPDTVLYAARGVRFFTRQSEYEREPPLYDHAAGVWIDGFQTDWFSAEDLRGHLAAGKDVCVVSPEIHGRNCGRVWATLKGLAGAWACSLMLCTDRPEAAEAYFRD
ncbi:MAG: hypothetical protein QME60_00360 [Verrucomicrobiota bacterium]|nr:hypothetical protein [Verrucomicrobiota bacterium]